VSLIQSILNSRKGNDSDAAEMSFVDHIEELRWHIVRSLIAVLLTSIVVFFNIEKIFDRVILGPAHTDFIAYRLLCKAGRAIGTDQLCLQDINLQFQNTELSGQFMMSFSTSFMIGFIVAFPYVFWEFWRFVRPALKEQELKYARGIVFWSSLLFFFGVLFAYYVIAPFTINFFANYQLSPSFKNIITMANYYETMTDLIMGMGLVFELPVIVFFLSRVGILTPRLMRAQRRYAIVVILVLAAIITPPDWFSIWLVAIPLIFLYEVGIGISARAEKARLRRQQLLS
jgi:sec-independent protein translocase protein TatC